MTDQLVLYENTYVTKKEADDYLKGSARAADLWAALSSVDRRRALVSAYREIERFRFEGVPTEVEYADTAVVAAGGTGYTANDVVTLVGGTGLAAQFKVLTETAGVVGTVGVVDAERGGYTATPANPAAVTGGTGGDDLTLTVTYKVQTASFPREGLTDKYGLAVGEFVAPADVEASQIELGFDISQDTAIEASGSTASNQKKLKAGSAEIEFFRPTDGTPLPTVPWDLLQPFIASATGATAGSAGFGTGCPSQFDDGDIYRKSRLGFP